MFAELSAKTIAIAREHGFEARELGLPFAHAVSELPSGTLTLTTQSHIAKGVGELRAMNLSSSKVDVVTMFLIPDTHRELPLYAMQLVSLGGRPIVAVLDAHTLCDPTTIRKRSDALLDEAKSRFRVSHSEDMPDWYKECCSGHEIFSRPESCEGFDGYRDAHLWLVRGLLAEYAGEGRLLSDALAAEHRDRCRAYLRHHAVNSAGKPLMSRAFGAEFTHRYLDECLFSAE
jgi:hypothetical protein